jgi:membrane dipeptidase
VRAWKRVYLFCAAVTAGVGVVLAGGEEDLRAKAHRLADEYLIVDTHIDVPYMLYRRWSDLSVKRTTGDFDYVRAREGGLDLPFMSIYVPAETEGTGRAKPVADSLIRLVRDMEMRWPEKFRVVTSVQQVLENHHTSRILLAMGMENGSPLEGDLANVRYFYDKGIRYITLAHAKDNHLADASYDTLRRWHGLSPFGAKVVAEMNRVGIMIDVSHLSDSAFYQVLRLSRAPVIASHSSCRHFTPGFERNMSDEMIRLLASAGGVIQINFGSSFLRNDTRRQEEQEQEDMEKAIREHHWAQHGSEAHDFEKKYRKDHPYLYATVSDVADHIDHVVKLVGIDYVGIGSDFDGVGDTTPRELRDVSCYPNLILELLKRGYSDAAIEKVCSGNLLRVWSTVERCAQGGKVK